MRVGVLGRAAPGGANDRLIGNVPVGITITNPNIPGMIASDTFQLEYDIQLADPPFGIPQTVDVSGLPVTWASSNESVATVSAWSDANNRGGLVTAVGAGSFTITATITGHGVSAQASGTVTGSVTPDGVTPSPTSLSGSPGQDLTLTFTIDDGGVPVTGRTPTAASDDGDTVAEVTSLTTPGDPTHRAIVHLNTDGSCNIDLGDSVEGVLGSVAVTVSTPGGVQPVIFEDYSTYTGADDAAKTTNFRNDQRNIYRAGEDKTLTSQYLVSGAGVGGKIALDLRYPPGGACTEISLSRALDIENLLGTGVKEIWFHAKFAFESGFTFHDAACFKASALKVMHASVRGTGLGRFGIAFFDTDYQGIPSVEWHGQAPIHVGNFNTATIFGQGYQDIWVHYKVNDPIGTANGIFAVKWPNGTTYSRTGLDIPSTTGFYKCEVTQNMNERPNWGTTKSLYIDHCEVFVADPGVGI